MRVDLNVACAAEVLILLDFRCEHYGDLSEQNASEGNIAFHASPSGADRSLKRHTERRNSWVESN